MRLPPLFERCLLTGSRHLQGFSTQAEKQLFDIRNKVQASDQCVSKMSDGRGGRGGEKSRHLLIVYVLFPCDTERKAEKQRKLGSRGNHPRDLYVCL